MTVYEESYVDTVVVAAAVDVVFVVVHDDVVP